MIMSESRTRKYSSVGFAILNHWLSTQGLLRMGYLHQKEPRVRTALSLLLGWPALQLGCDCAACLHATRPRRMLASTMR